MAAITKARSKNENLSAPVRDTTQSSGSDEEKVEDTTTGSLAGGNQGWANVFARVLTQNPKVKTKRSKKTLVLAKAKKDAELLQRKAALEKKAKNSEGHIGTPQQRREPLKIVDEDGNVVDEEELSSSEEDDEAEDEESSSDDEADSKKEVVDKQQLRRQRLHLRIAMPQPGDPYEKTLLRTATKGVVQLFNAVNKFQEEKRARLKDESSDEDERRYKKGRFMETLNRIQEKKQIRDEAKSTSKWEALRDDFMTDSKMRDWDKQDSDQDEDHGEH